MIFTTWQEKLSRPCPAADPTRSSQRDRYQKRRHSGLVMEDHHQCLMSHHHPWLHHHISVSVLHLTLGVLHFSLHYSFPVLHPWQVIIRRCRSVPNPNNFSFRQLSESSCLSTARVGAEWKCQNPRFLKKSWLDRERRNEWVCEDSLEDCWRKMQKITKIHNPERADVFFNTKLRDW